MQQLRNTNKRHSALHLWSQPPPSPLRAATSTITGCTTRQPPTLAQNRSPTSSRTPAFSCGTEAHYSLWGTCYSCSQPSLLPLLSQTRTPSLRGPPLGPFLLLLRHNMNLPLSLISQDLSTRTSRPKPCSWQLNMRCRCSHAHRSPWGLFLLVSAWLKLTITQVRAPDLRQLSSSSALSSALLSSPSSFQSPYLHQPPGYAFPNLATSISNACGSKVVASDLGQLASTTLDPRLKHTIFLRLPNAFHTTSKGDISDIGAIKNFPSYSGHSPLAIDSTLYSDLSHMASVYPNHIVVYSGGEHDGIVKRQDMKEVFTSADGGLLKRYQLLSPALITALLVTFFILIPTIFFGVNALSSIQSPLRGEVGKGFNAVEKKNQWELILPLSFLRSL